jgi:hypothetical protein
MLDNVAGATRLLESAQEGLALAIGEAFGQAKLTRIELYTQLTKDAAKWVKEHQKQIKAFADGFTKSVKFVIDNLDVMITTTKIFFALWAASKIAGITQSIVTLGKSFLVATPKVGGMSTAMRAYGVSATATATASKSAGAAMMGLNPILIGLTAVWVGLELALIGVKRAQDKIIASQEKMSESIGSTDTLGQLLMLRMEYDELVKSGKDFETIQIAMGKKFFWSY